MLSPIVWSTPPQHGHASAAASSTTSSRGHVAHQAMQQGRIRRKIVEIQLHNQLYSKTLIRPSNFAIFYAGLCASSAREHGSPRPFGRAPIDAFDQHRELRWRERHRAARLTQRGPYEAALLQPLVTQLGMQTLPLARRSLSA